MKPFGPDPAMPEMNIFDCLPNEAFRKVLAIGRRVKVPAGTVLLREGEVGDAVRVVLTGVVKVYKTAGGSASEVAIAELKSGSVFGEMGVFDNLPNSASVIAAEESILLEIPRGAMLDLLRAEPGIAFPLMQAMIQVLSARLRRANVTVSGAGGPSVRLADALGDALDGLLRD